MSKSTDGSTGKQQQTRQALQAGGAPTENKKPSALVSVLLFFKNLKMIHVVKYVLDLVKDLYGGRAALLHPRNSRDNAKRLLAMVWPQKWAGSGCSDADAKTRNYLLVMVGVGLLNLFLMEKCSSLTSHLTSALYKRQSGRVRTLLLKGVRMSAGIALASTALSWATSKMEVLWRGEIIRTLHGLYFDNMAYYHITKLKKKDRRTGIESLQFPHPDEQLSGEVQQASKRVVNMLVALTQSLPLLFWFTLKLLRERGVSFALLPHLYLFAAYEVVQRYLPKNFFILNMKLTKARNAFNSAVTRLEANAEAVAAVGGANVEADILNGKFDAFALAQQKLLATKSQFNLLIKLAYHYNFRPFMMTFIMTPMLFATHSSSSSSSSSNNSNNKTIALAQEVSSIQTVFSHMIQALASLGEFLNLHAVHQQHNRSTYYRVVELHDALVQLNTHATTADKKIYNYQDDRVAFSDVLVTTPTNHVLVEGLTFALEKGGSLLITGHNGAGKSSIFRCLGGLWKVSEGSITKPSREIFYIPQKPYQFLGSLRENICYPHLDSLKNLTDERLEFLLDQVGLSHLLDQQNDECDDERFINWSTRLGLGEQQRLAIARLFYHKPEFAILDECTSAVNREMETFLYQECQRLGITYITICHRPALKRWHQHNLHLRGNGTKAFDFVRIGDGRGGEDAVDNVISAAAAAAAAAGTSVVTRRTQTNMGSSGPTMLATKSATYKRQFAEARAANAANRRPMSAVEKTTRLLRIMLPGSYADVGKLLLAIGAQTALREVYGRIVGGMYAAMTQKSVSLFFALSAANFGLDILTAFVEEASNYMRNHIGVKWKVALSTRLRKLFLANDAFYKVKYLGRDVTDPAIRITQDIEDVATEFADIWGAAVLPAANCLWFGWTLSRYLTGESIGLLVAYAAASYALVNYGKPATELHESREQKLDGEFRFVHGRLREHAESIAFSDGGSREKGIADSYLDNLLKHQAGSADAYLPYNFAYRSLNKDDATTSAKYASVSTPILINTFLQHLNADAILGRADVGEGTSASAASAAVATAASRGFYVKQAIERIMEAFSRLTGIYDKLSSLMGSSDRVCELLLQLEALDHPADSGASGATAAPPAGGRGQTQQEQQLSLRHVDLVTPTGECLAADLDVTIEPHRSMLVTGRNSIGKTSFFRVLANLWPRFDARTNQQTKVTGVGGGGGGAGAAVTSSSSAATDLLLVPQKCYSVLGCFADQVTYPVMFTSAQRTEAVEARIWDALDLVGLRGVCETRGGLDAVDNWANNLSLGEQQRLGVARLLFHRPRFGVLDECTDAVSQDIEEKMYKSLGDAGVTCITISKRLTLEGFHATELALGVNNETGWELNQVAARPHKKHAAAAE